jgi:hypothetical protein
MINTISPKLLAAATGGMVGAVLSQVILWFIGAAAFGGGWSYADSTTAIAAVPQPLAAFVLLVITLAGITVPGYQITDPLRAHALDLLQVPPPDVNPDEPAAPDDVNPDAEDQADELPDTPVGDGLPPSDVPVE